MVGAGESVCPRAGGLVWSAGMTGSDTQGLQKAKRVGSIRYVWQNARKSSGWFWLGVKANGLPR